MGQFQRHMVGGGVNHLGGRGGGVRRLQSKAVFLSLQVVAWAAKPAYDPASPPTQVVNTTAHHMPLKLAAHVIIRRRRADLDRRLIGDDRHPNDTPSVTPQFLPVVQELS